VKVLVFNTRVLEQNENLDEFLEILAPEDIVSITTAGAINSANGNQCHWVTIVYKS
jgi:hypothetical protein